MTLKDLYNILLKVNVQVEYGFFDADDPPELPCITYEVAYTRNFSADRVVYQKISVVDIFLFEKHKDPELEERLEALLKEADIFWDMTETYLSDQRAYQIIYEVRIDG